MNKESKDIKENKNKESVVPKKKSSYSKKKKQKKIYLMVLHMCNQHLIIL